MDPPLAAPILHLTLVMMLAVVSVIDLKRRVIPNRVLAAAALIAIGLALAADSGSLPERAGSALAAGGVLFAAALLDPGGMGMGDVKLAATMGLFLGVAVIAALLAALLAGTAVGIYLVVRDGAAARKRAMPFGPFLALGGLAALLAGPAPIDWYLRGIV